MHTRTDNRAHIRVRAPVEVCPSDRFTSPGTGTIRLTSRVTGVRIFPGEAPVFAEVSTGDHVRVRRRGVGATASSEYVGNPSVLRDPDGGTVVLSDGGGTLVLEGGDG